MRAHSVATTLILCALTIGCSDPFASPDPTPVGRYPVDLDDEVWDILPYQFGYYDGLLETVVRQTPDTAALSYTQEAVFFNYLGNPYSPRTPFAVTANSTLLHDTSGLFLRFRSAEQTMPTSTAYWDVQGGPDAPTFRDSINVPDTIGMSFPNGTAVDSMPPQPFAIRYRAPGADSVYVQLLVIGQGARRLSLHVPNTGSFEIADAVVELARSAEAVEVDICAVNSKVHMQAGKAILIRAVVAQSGYFHFIQ